MQQQQQLWRLCLVTVAGQEHQAPPDAAAAGAVTATMARGRVTAAAVPTAAARAAGTVTSAHGRGESATAGANTVAPAGANTMTAFVGGGVRGKGRGGVAAAAATA
jgi:hypothetical protein